MIFARIKAAIAGFDEGTFVEAHALDAKTARKVPKKMIGRVLSPREVSAATPGKAAGALRRGGPMRV